MKQNQLYYYTSRKEQDTYYARKIYPYSEDFFMTAFFILKARGISTSVLIAGGGVTPADCAVPATAMVTVPAEVVDGSIPAVSAASSAGTSFPANPVSTTSWRLGSGEEAEGLQKRLHALSISMQQFQYLTIQQGSNFIPEGFDYMRFPFAHYPTTPWDQRQSFGQLHGWSGRVVPSRLPFSFPFRQGALAFGCFIAGPSFGCLSLFRFCRGAGKKVVWLGDVRFWWIAPVQLCVSLQKIFS
jgi:hypothetical protein